MMAAFMRMAAGGASGSEKKSEDVVVPPIPMPEKSAFRLADGTVCTYDEIDDAVAEQVVEITVGSDLIKDGGVFEITSGMLPNIRSLTIPDGLTTVAIIDINGITELTVPNTVKICAVTMCPNLKTLTLGSGVESLACAANNENLEIRISKENEHIKKEGGFIVSADESRLFAAVDKKTKSGNVTIPDGITSIEDGAFSYCRGLTGVMIPNSVTSIGQYAFYNCSGLMSVTIPGSVTSIGSGAFNNCVGLTTVNMGNRTVEYVQNMRFFSWGIGVYFDEEEQEHSFKATIRCSDGDIEINNDQDVAE